MREIPIDLVRKSLSYNPLTGGFIWRDCAVKRRIGMTAGKVNHLGYHMIKIAQQVFGAHRIAWAIIHGQPTSEVDHINGNRSDNRIANLRLATRAQNFANMKHRNAVSGYKGVDPCMNGSRLPWRARIRIPDGRRLDLGTFETAEEGGLAYEIAAERYWGEFAVHLSRGMK
jgi:hypothetical protein